MDLDPQKLDPAHLAQEVTLWQLLVFLAVCDAGDYSKAGRDIRIQRARQTVSEAINDLQAIFNSASDTSQHKHVLFEPQGKGVRPTEAARLLKPFVEEMFDKLREGLQAADNVHHGVYGTVVVAATTCVGPHIFNYFLETRFKPQSKYGGIHVPVRRSENHEITERMLLHPRNAEEEDIDFAIMGLMDKPDPLLESALFIPNHLVVIAHPDYGKPNPLFQGYTSEQPISLAQLAKEHTIILRERGSGTCESALRRFRERADIDLTDNTTSHQPVIFVVSHEGVMSLVRNKFGVAVIPVAAVLPPAILTEHIAQRSRQPFNADGQDAARGSLLTDPAGFVVLVPTEGFPIKRDWSLVRRQDKPFRVPAQQLWNALCDYGQHEYTSRYFRYNPELAVRH